MTRDPTATRRCLQQALSHHVVVVEASRLVLFTVPKAGCTDVLKLARRMVGHADWQEHPHYLDRPFLARCEPTRIEEILSDASWLKTALLRDPAERLLSAYLDKFVRQPGPVANTFREGGFGMAFDEFLDHVLHPNTDPALPFGLHAGTDPHWRPQALVGGIGRYAAVLRDVADFEAAAPWSRRVLTAVDAWETHGASGWGPHGESAIFEHNTAFNRTDAGARMREFYDADRLATVYDAYAADLELGRGFGLDLRHHRLD